jgi:single-stranded DNA-binding protein
MPFTIKGSVVEVSGEIQLTDSFKKRELIVMYADNPQYPEYIKIEAHNGRCDLVQDLAEGDAVEVDFNLKGKPWTSAAGKKTYFNQYVLYRIKTISQSYEPVNSGGGSVVVDKGVPEYQAPDLSASPDDDDLPF